MHEPQTWFHGLVADRTAQFSPKAAQVPFLPEQINRYGQPALDLGCGTGRLLAPLLDAGLDVDGCDLSGDMLSHCRAESTEHGLQPNLYKQPMHALDLPRQYRTIFMCAAFNLAGARDQGLETLRRCHQHLEDGGALLFDIDAEYACHEEWEKWEPTKRKDLPEPWPNDKFRWTAPDGTDYIEQRRTLSVDPLNQTMVRQVRVEKWAKGKLVDSQKYEQHRTLYLPNEIVLMLQIAGFQDITMHDGYTEEPATPDSDPLVFIALK